MILGVSYSQTEKFDNIVYKLHRYYKDCKIKISL